MRMHKIEVDQEVFDYLKSQAEPFTDTPNDVLRRLILGNTEKNISVQSGSWSSSNTNPPPVPPGTPKALEHTLQVIYLAHFLGVSRSKATKIIANIHDVAPQTVLDKYCRQLNLKASEFDRLLGESGLKSLKNKLHMKFDDHCEVIDDYLNN